ncbi:hypothetical protein JCM19275_1390 [Nonlabens ulvanivorans]|uniref:Uncharacterized protein n=1 Tax=Nonlabens ulvanivorans TaxID=906888 RepID=A0A090WIB2_NONUL|nr:hypothetical protein JCM19275_1390 [Nonlabens ulvanivorans]
MIFKNTLSRKHNIKAFYPIKFMGGQNYLQTYDSILIKILFPF